MSECFPDDLSHLLNCDFGSEDRYNSIARHLEQLVPRLDAWGQSDRFASDTCLADALWDLFMAMNFAYLLPKNEPVRRKVLDLVWALLAELSSAGLNVLMLLERLRGWAVRYIQDRERHKFEERASVSFAKRMWSDWRGDAVNALQATDRAAILRAMDRIQRQHLVNVQTIRGELFALVNDRAMLEGSTTSGRTDQPASPKDVAPTLEIDRVNYIAKIAGKKKALSRAQLEIIDALARVGAGVRLTFDKLVAKSGWQSPNKHLQRLRASDADWASIILMPEGRHGRGYGLNCTLVVREFPKDSQGFVQECPPQNVVECRRSQEERRHDRSDH